MKAIDYSFFTSPHSLVGETLTDEQMKAKNAQYDLEMIFAATLPFLGAFLGYRVKSSLLGALLGGGVGLASTAAFVTYRFTTEPAYWHQSDGTWRSTSV
jgi:uncharacterized membrane protein YjjP (DUF1212 family)